MHVAHSAPIESQKDRWWQHESLVAAETGLLLDGIPLANLADQHGTPLYVYSRATIQRQIALVGRQGRGARIALKHQNTKTPTESECLIYENYPTLDGPLRPALLSFSGTKTVARSAGYPGLF